MLKLTKILQRIRMNCQKTKVIKQNAGLQEYITKVEEV